VIATHTPCEKSREEAPYGIRFSARALTKNAFRFVKVRQGLAHKKASCQGRNPTFSRSTKNEERVEAKKKLDCGVVCFTLDKMAVLFFVR
jgi:hypothetical protein